VKTEEKLAQLLANPHPDEWIYEQIAKLYQELGDYEKAIANLDLAYETLKPIFLAAMKYVILIYHVAMFVKNY